MRVPQRLVATNRLHHFWSLNGWPIGDSYTKTKRAQEIKMLDIASQTQVLDGEVTDDFREQLLKWRNGRTQKAAAEFLKVPLRTYQAWEYGVNKPSELARKEIERRMAEIE